jgi:hypothetical protein
MIVSRADVVRHFLRLEATRPKYSQRKNELLAWCKLSDSDVLAKARHFGEQRDDVNPALVYTVGVGNDARYREVTSWTRERVRCVDIYTCGISSCMRADIDAVRGNVAAFAAQSSSNYPEFRSSSHLSEISSIIILVHHRRPHRDGQYEAVDGVHRLVARCCARVRDVETYVGHLSRQHKL